MEILSVLKYFSKPYLNSNFSFCLNFQYKRWLQLFLTNNLSIYFTSLFILLLLLLLLLLFIFLIVLVWTGSSYAHLEHCVCFGCYHRFSSTLLTLLNKINFDHLFSIKIILQLQLWSWIPLEILPLAHSPSRCATKLNHKHKKMVRVCVCVCVFKHLNLHRFWFQKQGSKISSIVLIDCARLGLSTDYRFTKHSLPRLWFSAFVVVVCHFVLSY